MLVTDDIGVANGGQDADLVDSILDFLGGHWDELHLLQRVNLAIFDSLDFIDVGELPFAELADHLEFRQAHPY